MKLKYLIVNLFAILILFSGNVSCSETNQNEDIIVEDGQSILWKIEGNNLSKPSYLFGTMHIIPKTDFRFGKRVKEITENSELILMEIDFNPEAMMELAFMAMIPDGKTLKEISTPEEYVIIYSFLKDSFNLSPMELMTYQSIKPILLTEMLMSNVVDEELVSIDLEILSIAEANQLQVKGLESIEEQIALLEEIPLEEQASNLAKSLLEFEELKNQLNKLIGYYREQQIDALYQMMIEDEFLQNHDESLLYERNENWIEPIEEAIQQKSVFIAVGAGHLSGERGLINLLRDKGYIVQPVSTD